MHVFLHEKSNCFIMLKFILTPILVIICTLLATPSYAQENNDSIQIALRKKTNPTNPDIDQHPSLKSPATRIAPCTIYYKPAEQVLSFSSESCESLSYIIYDESENSVASGLIIFMDNSPVTVSVSSLNAGNYQIILFKDDNEYEGELTINP